jgi:hypothetical protein
MLAALMLVAFTIALFIRDTRPGEAA